MSSRRWTTICSSVYTETCPQVPFSIFHSKKRWPREQKFPLVFFLFPFFCLVKKKKKVSNPLFFILSSYPVARFPIRKEEGRPAGWIERRNIRRAETPKEEHLDPPKLASSSHTQAHRQHTHTHVRTHTHTHRCGALFLFFSERKKNGIKGGPLIKKRDGTIEKEGEVKNVTLWNGIHTGIKKERKDGETVSKNIFGNKRRTEMFRGGVRQQLHFFGPQWNLFFFFQSLLRNVEIYHALYS